MMANFANTIADVSSGFKQFSTRVLTSQTTPNSAASSNFDTPMVIATSSTPPPTSDPTRSSSASAVRYTRQPLPQLDQVKYPGVKHWDNNGYNGSRKGGKRGGEDSLEGKAKSSVLSSFMEDQNGRPISDKGRKKARKAAKQFFQELLDNGRAPPNWGDAPRDVENELIHILESEYDWVRLCEGHWKANKIATNSYSQWYSKAIKRKAAADAKKVVARKRAEAEVIDVDSDDSDDSDNIRTSKRPRDEEDKAPEHPKRPRTEGPQLTPRPRPRPTPIQTNRPRIRVRCSSFP